MYPIKISFGKKCPTIVITSADSSSSTTSTNDPRKDETKAKNNGDKYRLQEEEKENLNKGKLSFKYEPHYFDAYQNLE